jgi:hypothetical protein
VFETAVAARSVKSAIRDAASLGMGAGWVEDTIMTPHRCSSTKIGVPTEERTPSSRRRSTTGPDVCVDSIRAGRPLDFTAVEMFLPWSE